MFITFEGPEGGGKTSQIPPLVEFLRGKGYSLTTTREPGGTEIGDQIRKVLFDMKNTAMRPRTEILLLLASRAQIVEEVIRPNLNRGDIVICDRYTDSTLAYQGFGHGVDIEELRRLNRFATGGLVPDLTLLIDVDVEDGLQRRSQEGTWNRLDAYPLAFHRRVYQGYRELAREEPERWNIIDANRPMEAVQSEIRQVILKRLLEKFPN